MPSDGLFLAATDTTRDLVYLVGTALLVIANGFFVAAEFALVKLRPSQLESLVREGRPFSKTAKWLADRMDQALSACQLGITMASLGLGWIGEPALHHLMVAVIGPDFLAPIAGLLSIDPDTLMHTIAFLIAFGVITALHLVIGEQAPKIFALRKPETMTLWCALPLKWFYVLSYPMLVALDRTTAWLLGLVGVVGSGHDSPLSEEEIRSAVHTAHGHGELTGAERQLIQGVFEFDDLICRRVMVPRNDVIWIDASATLDDIVDRVHRHGHSRYPVCEGSLDKVVGILHAKDLVGLAEQDEFDLRSMLRPAQSVPETVPVSRLLRQFQASHQLMAIVVDEYGTVAGIVSMENVLEPIIGPVDDEFDVSEPDILKQDDGTFLVRGSTIVQTLNREFELDIDIEDVDTFSGLLVKRLDRLPRVGDRVDLGKATAEVVEVQDRRAHWIRLKQDSSDNGSD